MEKKRTVKQYINFIRRKKEVRSTIIYSVSYFVYITLLMAFGAATGKI
jgi:hypothetical protein